MHASVTSLTYGQLILALAVSRSTAETRYRAYFATLDAILVAVEHGEDPAEFRADAPGLLASWREQAAMTNTLADEISARVKRGDYA